MSEHTDDIAGSSEWMGPQIFNFAAAADRPQLRGEVAGVPGDTNRPALWLLVAAVAQSVFALVKGVSSAMVWPAPLTALVACA